MMTLEPTKDVIPFIGILLCTCITLLAYNIVFRVEHRMFYPIHIK